ncbi:MAG: polysaccharide deacetylase [Sideroxydans sp.]|nr:polysaccharide deacetylase [Sideroxydans sp.]
MKLRYILGTIYAAVSKANFPTSGYIKVLTYHDVPAMHTQLFKRQIETATRFYRFISVETFEQMLAGTRPIEGINLLLTFDDGYASQATLAESVLEPLGITALFFVPSAFIGINDLEQQKEFIAEQLFAGRIASAGVPAHMKPMSWSDLKRLVAQGHTIGAHTCTHPVLSKSGTQSLEREITESSAILEDHLKACVKHFAYPFGRIDDLDPGVLNMIKSRYSYCYSGIRGANTALTSPYALLREAIDPIDPPEYMRFVIENGLAFLYRRRVRRLVAMLN